MKKLLIVCFIILILSSPTLASLAVRSFPAASPRLETSFIGTQLVKQFEGLMLCEYIDDAGHPTIGYGHKIVETDDLPRCITPKKAHELLVADLRRTERCVSFYVEAPMDQHHFDALSSFTFNLGCGNLLNSTLRKKLNQLDYTGAANEFPRWNKARVNGKLVELRGLTLRRWAEKYVFEG